MPELEHPKGQSEAGRIEVGQIEVSQIKVSKMADHYFGHPISSQSKSTLMLRAQQFQILGAELAPELYSIATTGSMLESLEPTHGKYVTELQAQTVERTREFGRLAVTLGGDLRASFKGKGKSLADVFRDANMELPEVDLGEYLDWGLVDLATALLIGYGNLLSDLDLGNPGLWENFKKAGRIVVKLAPVALPTIGLVLFLTGGTAAVGAAPFVVAGFCYPIVVQAIELARELPR